MDAPDLWTLDQLTEQVEVALAVDYAGAPSGRVRSVPDRRAIRWYTTIGLVDRPAAMRGRTALYAERHLLQLVAIKRRQADGRSLAEIQAELAGATDALLRSIARLPNGTPAGPHAPATPRAGRFWSAPAATPTPVPAAMPTPAPAAATSTPMPAATAPTTLPATSTAMPAAATHTPVPAANAPIDVAANAAAGFSAAVRPAGVISADASAAAVDTQAAEAAGSGRPREDGGSGGNDRGGPAGVAVAPAITLPGGVALLLPAGAPYPTEDDLHAVRTAATRLLAELNRRGLTDTDSTEGTP